MKLTVLSENAVLYPGLEGEFGLSVYLEEGDTRLLFDAGERDACLRNAEKLGIDLRRSLPWRSVTTTGITAVVFCAWRSSFRRTYPFMPIAAFSSGSGGITSATRLSRKPIPRRWSW